MAKEVDVMTSGHGNDELSHDVCRVRCIPWCYKFTASARPALTSRAQVLSLFCEVVRRTHTLFSHWIACLAADALKKCKKKTPSLRLRQQSHRRPYSPRRRQRHRRLPNQQKYGFIIRLRCVQLPSSRARMASQRAFRTVHFVSVVVSCDSR